MTDDNYREKIKYIGTIMAHDAIRDYEGDMLAALVNALVNTCVRAAYLIAYIDHKDLGKDFGEWEKGLDKTEEEVEEDWSV